MRHYHRFATNFGHVERVDDFGFFDDFESSNAFEPPARFLIASVHPRKAYTAYLPSGYFSFYCSFSGLCLVVVPTRSSFRRSSLLGLVPPSRLVLL